MELQRCAFSTLVYSRHSLDHALKQIAATGFKSVELLADKPHVWLDSFDAVAVGKLKAELARLGLSVANVNAQATSGYWNDVPPEPVFEPSLISRNRALREWRIAYVKKALRLAKELGAECVSITSGRALNGMPPESAQKTLLEGLKRVLEYAEKLGQRLALACAPTLLVETTDEQVETIKKLKSAYFGALLDVGHVAALGENPSQAVRKLKGHICGVHLADIRGRKAYPRLPGEGDLNFRAIFRALDDAGYAAALTWNPSTYDEEPDFACRKTLRFVKTLGKVSTGAQMRRM